MKVHITGSKGFIGKHLVKKLSRCKDIKITSFEESDVVVHLAAKIHGSWEEMWYNNYNFTCDLLDFSKKKHFIFISSENVNHNLHDTYTQTKRYAEYAVMVNKSWTILRPTVVYGPNDKKYVARLKQIIKKSPIVPIIGDGMTLFQFTYVGDLVDTIIHCIRKKPKGAFVVAGPDKITFNDLVAKLNKKNKPVIHIPLFIAKPFAYLSDWFSDTPTITPGQIENLKIHRMYDDYLNVTKTKLDKGLWKKK